MALRAGTLSDWGPGGQDSMAKQIEAEMLLLAPLQAGEDPLGRRKLCVAIARGVLRYLRDHDDSIKVTLTNGSVVSNRLIQVDATL